MERIKKLNMYQKGVLILLAAMFVIFTAVYFIVTSKVGFKYNDVILCRLFQKRLQIEKIHSKTHIIHWTEHTQNDTITISVLKIMPKNIT